MKCPSCGGALNEQAVCVDCGHYDAGAAEHIGSVSRPANGPDKPIRALYLTAEELDVLKHALAESRMINEQPVLVILDKIDILKCSI